MKRVYKRRYAPKKKFARRSFARPMAITGPANYRTGGLILAKTEWKSVDVAVSDDCDSTGAVLLVNGIARGDDIGERNGRQIVMKSFEIRAQDWATIGTGLAQSHRIMLVYDKQANGAALTVAMVLLTASITSPRNLENRQRFVVLMDKVVNLAEDGAGGLSSVMWQAYKRLNLPVTFNSGDAGTVADIITGSLYLLYIGDKAAGAIAGTLSTRMRLRYEDA